MNGTQTSLDIHFVNTGSVPIDSMKISLIQLTSVSSEITLSITTKCMYHLKNVLKVYIYIYNMYYIYIYIYNMYYMYNICNTYIHEYIYIYIYVYVYIYICINSCIVLYI